MAILAVMIFTLAGLVIDGGRQLGARSRAVGYAQEAARVGAAAIQLNNAEAKIDTTKAATAIDGFCAQVKSNDSTVTSCGPTTLTDEAGRHPGRHRQQDDVPGPHRQAEPESRRHRPGPRRARHQEGRRQPDDPLDRGQPDPGRPRRTHHHRGATDHRLPLPDLDRRLADPDLDVDTVPVPGHVHAERDADAGPVVHASARESAAQDAPTPPRQAVRDRRNVIRA